MNSYQDTDILVSKRIEPLILEQLIALLDVKRTFATSIEEARKKTPVGAPISVFKSNYSASLVMPLLFCASIVVILYNDRFFNKDDPSDRVKKGVRSNASKKSLLRKYSYRLRKYEKQNSTVPNKSMIMSTVYMILLKNGIAYFDAENVSSDAELLKEKQQSPLKRQIDQQELEAAAAANDDKISFSKLVEQFSSRFSGKTRSEDKDTNKKYEELHGNIEKFPRQFARLINHPISNPECLKKLNPIEEGEEGEEGRDVEPEEKKDSSVDFNELSSPLCENVTDKKDDSIKVETKSGGIKFYIKDNVPNGELPGADRNPLHNAKLAYGQHMDKFEDDIVQWIRIIFKGFKDFYHGTNERKMSGLMLAFNSAISNQLVKDTANGTFYKLLEQPKMKLLPGEDYEITLMLEQLNALIDMVTQSGNNGIVIDVEKGMNIDDPEYISKTVEECGGFSGGMILFLYNLWEHEDGRWLEISKKYVNAIISYGDKLRIRQLINPISRNQIGGNYDRYIAFVGDPKGYLNRPSDRGKSWYKRIELISGPYLKEYISKIIMVDPPDTLTKQINMIIQYLKTIGLSEKKTPSARPAAAAAADYGDGDGAPDLVPVPSSVKKIRNSVVNYVWYHRKMSSRYADTADFFILAGISYLCCWGGIPISYHLLLQLFFIRGLMFFNPNNPARNWIKDKTRSTLPTCITRDSRWTRASKWFGSAGTRRKKSKNTKKNNYSNHRKMSKKINKRTSNIRRRTIKY